MLAEIRLQIRELKPGVHESLMYRSLVLSHVFCKLRLISHVGLIGNYVLMLQTCESLKKCWRVRAGMTVISCLLQVTDRHGLPVRPDQSLKQLHPHPFCLAIVVPNQHPQHHALRYRQNGPCRTASYHPPRASSLRSHPALPT